MTDPSFRKITFNAHETTCAWFEARYGYGWSERVRDLMDRHMMDTDRSDAKTRAAKMATPLTLEDFARMYPEGNSND